MEDTGRIEVDLSAVYTVLSAGEAEGSMLGACGLFGDTIDELERQEHKGTLARVLGADKTFRFQTASGDDFALFYPLDTASTAYVLRQKLLENRIVHLRSQKTGRIYLVTGFDCAGDKLQLDSEWLSIDSIDKSYEII